ncbi:MAG TPA: hypothetical protein DIU20_07265 [Cryomorphaceae bacterium]|nr:hypothetical protein [Cryomorphaceae bacterium]
MKALLLNILVWISSLGLSQSLDIYQFDVGQGSLTLFLIKNAQKKVVESILLDGGTGYGGEYVLSYLKQELKLDTLNRIIASHYDGDHIGGLITLMNANFPIKQVMDRGPGSKNTALFTMYTNLANQRQRITLKPGDIITSYAENNHTYLIQCIAVNRKVWDPSTNSEVQTGINSDDENDQSIVVLIQAQIGTKKFRYVNGGDIGGIKTTLQKQVEIGPNKTDLEKFNCRCANIESPLIQYNNNFDVFTANHHGSNCSSNNDWVSLAKATVVVISSGKNGMYKHPKQSVINRFENNQSIQKIFLTYPKNEYLRWSKYNKLVVNKESTRTIKTGTKKTRPAGFPVLITVPDPANTNGYKVNTYSYGFK